MSSTEAIRSEIIKKLKQLRQIVNKRSSELNIDELMQKLWEEDVDEEELKEEQENKIDQIRTTVRKLLDQDLSREKRQLKKQILDYLLDDSNTNRFVMK